MNRIKKVLSMFLAILMITLAIPIGDFVSYADSPVVEAVVVTRVYDEITSRHRYTIDIRGKNFLNINNKLALDIEILNPEGKDIKENPTSIKNTRIEYSDVKAENISHMVIGGKDINISRGVLPLPTLSGKEPGSGAVKSEVGEFVLRGTGFNLLKSHADSKNKVTGGVQIGTELIEFNFKDVKDVKSEDGKEYFIESNILKEKLGKYNVVFERSKTENLIKITTRNVYLNTFRAYKELAIGKPVKVYPTRGPIKTRVKLESTSLLETNKMSVFLVKDLDDKLTLNHMSKYEHFSDKNAEGNQVFTFEVPDTLGEEYDNVLGDYYIVLTNNVDPKTGDPEEDITSRTELEQKFTLVDSKVSMSLDKISPNEGSVSGGIKARISGRYIGSMSPNVNIIEENNKPTIRREDGALVVEYTGGKYSELGPVPTGQSSVKYESLKRRIKVQIGTEVLFKDPKEDSEDNSEEEEIDVIINPAGNDEIGVTIPPVTLGKDENPVKDVYVSVETTIRYKDENENEKTITFIEEDTLKDGFTYLPIGYEPKIEGVFPDLIPVDSEGRVKPKEVRLIIRGENFTLHRYEDKDGKIKYKYPVIDLAGDSKTGSGKISINKNEEENKDEIYLKIFDSEGEEITGRPGDNLGSKIVVEIPEDAKVDIENINTNEDLRVTNPLLNEEEITKGKNGHISNMGSSSTYPIKFVNVDEILDKTPTIGELIPNVVKTTGYEGAIIRGSNFLPGIKMHIDGEEVTNIEINDIGTQLTFDLPPKREGEYQLVLQNEEGPMAITTVEYIKSYTNLRFDDFNPKKGTAGTVVTVTGGGFLRPANTKIMDISTAAIAKRLIGTTVYLGGVDVNDYNLDKDGKIELQPFIMDGKLLEKDEDNRTKLIDYSNSLILVEELEGKESYYSIYRDEKTGKYKLSDTVDEYTLELEEDKIKASLRGEEYTIEKEIYEEPNKSGTELILKAKNGTTKTFKVKTPYLVRNGKIIGNRVRVISEKELTFKVKSGLRQGYHDVKVENPDTNNDVKKGNEGFYYYAQPQYNPKIKSIEPNEGSVEGGYTIDIIARQDGSGQFRGFINDGIDDRTSVTIGLVTVPPEDITVSSDGYTMTVTVPKYPGDLESETEMNEKSVNVVVVNPDGGSDSVENGFTYVIPKSRPILRNLFRKEGGASGGEIVVIEGSDFRYFEPFQGKNDSSVWDDDPFNDLNKNGEFDDLGTNKVYVGAKGLKNLEELTKTEWERFVKPILPKVNFLIDGEKKEAEIVFFELGRIEVKTPEGVNGPAEVYLVNNDNGMSNKLIYDYQVTNPIINRVTPNTASRKGGQDIQILGDNFVESKVKVIQSENNAIEKNLQLVQFGNLEDKNISNRSNKLGELDKEGFDNSGKIANRQSETYVRNLNLQYDAKDPNNKKLEFTIEEGEGSDKKTYKLQYNGWDEKDIYLSLNALKNIEANEDGVRENYLTTEMVKVSLETIEGARLTKRLRLDRGFSPDAKLKSSKDISVKVPTYYTIGETLVRVINSDNQEATKEFTYSNPLSEPRITRILRNDELPVEEGDLKIVKVPYTGGSRIKLEGIDFLKDARVEIGGVAVDQNLLEFYPEGQTRSEYIMFTIGGVDERRVGEDYRVALINPDRGSTITTDIRIRYTKPESVDLSVTSVVPNNGPTKGGTEVTIHGNDFRREMDGHSGEFKVFFEKGNRIIQVSESDIISVDLDKIVLRTPAFSAGSANIIIENPDGNSVRLLDGFLYTSDPKITSVVGPEDDKLLVEKISVEGGERIKIKGSDFLEGATVTFNPELEAIGDNVKDENLPQGEIVVINGRRYILKSGVDGIDVEVLDSQNILVTTPEGKLGDKGILVRNPDGGVSNVYNLEYGIPEVGAPFDVRAELVYDQFIRVNWAGVRNALEYEIYVSVDGKKFEFIDSTELTSFSYVDILPRTKYEFMVRAIGQYGTSKPLDESKSNIVRTGNKAGPEDLDGELGENTVVKRQGTLADISIGSRDFSSQGYTIDLTRGELAGVRDITIRMPAEIITSYSSGEIRVLGTDYSMSFNPSVFRNSAMESNKNNANAGVVFKVSAYNGEIGNAGGKTVAGPRYKLEGETYVDKNKTQIGRLAGGINLNMDSNNVLVRSRNLRNLGLSRHYQGNNSWINTKSVDRMAIYAITGSRR